MTENRTWYVVICEGWFNRDTGHWEFQFYPSEEPENFQEIDELDYQIFIADRCWTYEDARDSADELERGQEWDQ